MLVLFTSTSEKGKMLSHQIIYDLQFLQVTLNKQSRQNCSVCLRASPNQTGIKTFIVWKVQVEIYVYRKQPQKIISGSKKKNFMEFIYIYHQNLLLLQIRFPYVFDVSLF